MIGLDLDKLKRYKNEILKAEIGALLFNLGKTHIGFWRRKEDKEYFQFDDNSFKDIFGYSPFSGYKKYYQKNTDLGNKSPFEYELEKYGLKDFIFDKKIKLPFDIDGKKEINWVSFFKGDALEKGEDGKTFIREIFFRGCENINSGIDKGSPNKQLEPPLWISNAFGSFKERINEFNFDQRRLCFYANLSSFLSRNGYFLNPNWEEIRNFVLKEVRDWYSYLLSDSRFPVNDVSLFDQAYMTASMFKAVLSQLVMDSSKLNSYQNNPSSIKWRILGIQYDKVGVAEKSLKLASIAWYRGITEKIDEEIRKLLEVEYPIGNEIYRDETGIYFIVGEDIGEDLNDGSNLAKLRENLREIEYEILEKFKDSTNDEFYPAIFLTKASRGLMNLSTLLERAKENFLKANWKNKDGDLCLVRSINGKAIGICPVCQVRLIYEKDKEKQNRPTICEVCDNRIHHRQVSKWIKNLTGETIWIDEVKDKNDRVAYVSLKFELEDWLSGNLLNSLLGQKSDFKLYLAKIKSFLEIFILNRTNFLDIFSELDEQIRSLEEKLKSSSLNQEEKGKLGQKKGLLEGKKGKLSKIKNIINKLVEEKWWIKPLDTKYSVEGYSNWDVDEYIQKINKLLGEVNFGLKIKNPFQELSEDAYNGCKNNKESFNDFIKQIFFGSVIGTQWEEWIKTTPLNSKINWEREEIKWEEFNDENDPALDLLATLLLQFLLRKNPSPARLRRIWETTREFFKEIHYRLASILGIPKWRKKRLVWEVELNENNKLEKSMELEAEGLYFWAEKEGNKAKIYLISSIRSFLEKFGNSKVKKALENLENLDIEKEILKDKETFKNNNYIQNKKITLYPSDKKKDDENKIELDIKNNITKEIHFYKPYTLITDPSPINYQVVIPAECLPKLIDEVIDRYNKEFKYVYGKLPIHIGIVISDYKKPVYVNLKALRKIRRNVKDVGKLYGDADVDNILQQQKRCAQSEEKINNTESYYSLYWDNKNKQDYNFYIKPDERWKKWISTIDKFKSNQKVKIIPNTFDFEYLDHNIRRNEIFYDEKDNQVSSYDKKVKRVPNLKKNRPYELEVYWPKFKAFIELFKETNLQSSRLHKLIEILYSKITFGEVKDYSFLFVSSFINWLELNKKGEEYTKRRKLIAEIFDLDVCNFDSLTNEYMQQLRSKLEQKENVLLFIDMFEFWHTALKEV